MQQENIQPEISSHSAELFHLIVENVKDYAIFMTDSEGVVVSWNPGVERLLGYSEKEIVGQSITIIFTPEDTADEVPLKEMELAARTGCSEDKRWHVRRDGSRFWANGMVMPLKSGDGALRGFAKIMRDDTAQKLAEQKLEQTNRRIENLLSSISDSFYTFDSEFRYVFVNEATTRMFALSEAEFIGKSLWEVFPDVAGNNFHTEILRAFKEQTTIVFENYYAPLDRWFENRIYPQTDGLSVFTTEITSRKRSEQALVESEERYRRLFDSIDEGFCVIKVLFGADGKASDYRFLEFNPAFEKLTGIPAVEALSGKTIREIVPEFEEKFIETYGRVVQTGEPIRFVENSVALGRWFDVYAFRVGEPGEDKAAVLFTNITKSKQTEKVLRESEERYRALIEATSTTVWHADPGGGLTFAGDIRTQITGQSTAEILEWGWLDAVHPDDRRQTVEKWQAALRDKTMYRAEFRILTLEGEYRWFEANAVPVFEPDGSVREWVGINTDIHERIESEDALRRSEEKFATLAEAVPQLVWMAEADGFIFWYNRNWYEYTGTTPADMKGWGWETVHDPETLPQVKERWQASIETGEPFEMEFPLRGADGKFRWFLTRVNPLRDSAGKITRWFGTNTDIDEKRRLELRNRFIIDLDQAVRPLETPEEITRTLARLLGEYIGADRCAYAQVESDEDHFYIPGDYTRGETQSIVGHYRMADFGEEVLRLMRANQTYVVDDVDHSEQVTPADLAAYRMTSIQAVICVPLHKNNRFTACMAVHQKQPRRWLPEEVEIVTFVANRFWESIERARIIKSLHESFAREQEARQIAEHANKIKDEFLATLSHELRTPLNAILGWSQLLQNSSLPEPEVRRALTTIERSARAQSQLVDDLLDVSRIITGKLRLNVRAFELSGVIGAAVDAVRPAADAKSIDLEILTAPNAPPIFGDSDRVQQFVWNLLSNAVKFTPPNGRVRVSTEFTGSHVEIIVSDSGKGIEPEFLPFVFDRFRQSDGSMTRRHGGLGLGLAIVRQLVELHGGTVSVESAGVDQGSTFIINLPLQAVPGEELEKAARKNPEPGTVAEMEFLPELTDLRVLLVEDEPDSRNLINLLLTSRGAKVAAVSSAAEAFETINGENFDVMISDIGMPEEDGFSLIKKIRQLPAGQGGDIPAIALTAYAGSEDRVQALRSGFQTHIAKPFDSGELIAVVANLAGRVNPLGVNESA